MTRHLSKYFGDIDLDNFQECYETEIEFNGRPIELTINVSALAKELDKNSVIEIDEYIENLDSNEDEIRRFIQQNFQNHGEAKNYIDFQIEGQEMEDIVDVIEKVDQKISQEERLLSVLYLLRITFYPEKKSHSFAVFDYTISEELTDDLLVIVVSKDKEIGITIES